VRSTTFLLTTWSTFVQILEFNAFEQGHTELNPTENALPRARRAPPLAPRHGRRRPRLPGRAPAEATHLQGAAHPKGPLKFSPCHAPRDPSPDAHHPSDRWSVRASPCRALLPRPAHAPRGVAVGSRVASRHAGHHKRPLPFASRAEPRPRSCPPPCPPLGPPLGPRAGTGAPPPPELTARARTSPWISSPAPTFAVLRPR
jgi:hypothetical protein